MSRNYLKEQIAIRISSGNPSVINNLIPRYLYFLDDNELESMVMNLKSDFFDNLEFKTTYPLLTRLVYINEYVAKKILNDQIARMSKNEKYLPLAHLKLNNIENFAKLLFVN